MKTSSISGYSNVLSIVASLICAASVLGFVKSKETEKPLILNIVLTSSAIAISSKVSSNLCSKVSEDIIKENTQSHQLTVKNLEQSVAKFQHQLQQSSKVLTEKSELNKTYEQTIESKQKEIVINETALAICKTEVKRLNLLIAEKASETNARFNDICQELKQVFIDRLKEKIDYTYEQLANSSASKKDDDNFAKIHPTLQDFYDSLKDSRIQHYQLLAEIADLDNENLADEFIGDKLRKRGNCQGWYLDRSKIVRNSV